MKIEIGAAKQIAIELKKALSPFSSKIEICGSIRRNCQKVHDIDIVLVPSDRFGLLVELKKRAKIKKFGKKMISGTYKEVPFDIYFASPSTFETLKLIRTGSKDFNKKLCVEAKKRGWKLKADGTGLIDKSGKIIASSEREIIEMLLGEYVEPCKR